MLPVASRFGRHDLARPVLLRTLATSAALAALCCGRSEETEAPPSSSPNNARGIAFDDHTEQAGVAYSWRMPPGASADLGLLGAGAVAEDLDGDGHIDLLVGGASGDSKLFWNRGDGTFIEGAAAAGVLMPGEWVVGVAAADYDNDGDQDLFLNSRTPIRLLRNDGQRRFTDVSAAAGFNALTGGAGITFGDLDGDGWLDVFVGGTQLGSSEGVITDMVEVVLVGLTPAHVLKGSPSGVFEDVSAELAIPDGNPLSVGMLDLDGDFDVELFIEQDTQGRVQTLMYENVGVRGGPIELRNVSEKCDCRMLLGPMGLGVIDVDDNGLPELFISNLWLDRVGREALLFNRGSMQFQDVAQELTAFAMDPFGELGNRSSSWATMAFDVENDTFEDLFIVYGELVWEGSKNADPDTYPHLAAGQPDALLSRAYDGRFELQTGTGLEDTGRAQAAVVADFDGDGCEDVYVVNLETPARLYRNRCSRALTYVELQLEGRLSNRDAVGARVRLETAERVQWRHVMGCSTGLRSCMPKRVHFGLGDAQKVAKVDIYWPSGHIQRIGELGVNQLHRIVEVPP